MIKAETDNLEDLNKSRNNNYYFVLFIFASPFVCKGAKFVIKSKIFKVFKAFIIFKFFKIFKTFKIARVTRSKTVFTIFVFIFIVNTQIKRKRGKNEN